MQTPSPSCSPKASSVKGTVYSSCTNVAICIMSLGAGHDLSVTCLGTGSPPASLQWYEGQRIINVVAHKLSFLAVHPEQLTTMWFERRGASAALLTEVCPEAEVLNSAEPHRADPGTGVMGWMVQ